MTDQPMGGGMSGDISNDDRLWALLAYLFSPLVPIILLVWEEKKNRPFIKSHNIQALVLGAANVALATVLTPVFFLGCCTGLGLGIYQIYCAIQAYGGKPVTIPFVTDFIKNQGWA